MKVKEIIEYLEAAAPLYLQEEYDNCGLQTGSPEQDTDGALVTLDIDEGVIDEAIGCNHGLIIAHHPLIFKPVRRITGATAQERCLIKAIRHGIAVYIMHTNIDNAEGGLNHALAGLFGIEAPRVMLPGIGMMNKVIVFCPEEAADRVMTAMSIAGAGHIGNYDMCSFQAGGEGTFRALDGANPYVGSVNSLHREREVRLEMVAPIPITSRIVEAMKREHPYEEVAFDVIRLVNPDTTNGAGAFGELPVPVTTDRFVEMVKEVLDVPFIRHTALNDKIIRRIGVCGGSGAFLVNRAIELHLDALVTADVKYHQFAEAAENLLLVDAGHYETEILVTRLISQKIQKKFPNFACRIAQHCPNPVKYS